jgi:hypothetical protein
VIRHILRASAVLGVTAVALAALAAPAAAYTPPDPPWEFWGTFATGGSCTQTAISLKNSGEAQVTRCFFNGAAGYDLWYEQGVGGPSGPPGGGGGPGGPPTPK